MLTMTQDTRRGKVTPEHIEEAKRLKALWEEAKPQLAQSGLDSQAAFGERYGIGNQAAVGFFLNGKTALSMKAALAFCTGLGCRLSDFSPRLAAEASSQIEAMSAALGIKRTDPSLTWEAVCRSSVQLMDPDKARGVVMRFLEAVDARYASLTERTIRMNTT